MHYRIATALVVFVALIGLPAPAAFAAPNPLLAKSCTVGQDTTPAHVMTNDNSAVGIAFPGPGNQAIVTTSPARTSFKCVDPADGYVIHDQRGHCLRMRDASNNFAVMEESSCNDSDNNERFVPFLDLHNSQLEEFLNIGTGDYLGVVCGVQNGWKIWGVSGASGTCFNWRVNYL